MDFLTEVKAVINVAKKRNKVRKLNHVQRYEQEHYSTCSNGISP